MSSSGDINNLLGLAKSAALGGNQEEALVYFNRVLEADPTLSEAWVGKGTAAGWLSSLANIRVGEAAVAFGHAIANADVASRSAVASDVTREMNAIVVAIYGMAKGNLNEFATLDNTWGNYLGQVSILLDGLEQARTWSPDDRDTLENIVHLCKDNIEGYAGRDQYNQNMPFSYSITPEYEKLLQTRMTSAIEGLRAIDPSYAAPQIEKKEADSCFVATAAMGSIDEPHVVTLRRFRDLYLAKSNAGRAFIGWYYQNGPHAAAVIAKHKRLRAFCRILVVRPAAFFAGCWLSR